MVIKYEAKNLFFSFFKACKSLPSEVIPCRVAEGGESGRCIENMISIHLIFNIEETNLIT